jgi:hypothetical protein
VSREPRVGQPRRRNGAEYVRSNVLGLVAIFIALSGTAWAAASIGAGHIKDNAVRSSHIKNGEVKGGDVKDGAILGNDVNDLTFDAADIASRTTPQFGIKFFEIPEDGIQGPEVENGTLTGPDVLNASLTGSDVATGSIAGLHVADESIDRVDLTPEARGPAAYSMVKESTGLLCGDFCTQGSLTGMQEGLYLLLAKITVNAKDFDQRHLAATCRLRVPTGAGGPTDGSRITLAGTDESFDAATLSMHLAAFVPESGEADVDCWDTSGGPAEGGDLRITAISLGSLN